jgi:uncharacterized membrane protein
MFTRATAKASSASFIPRRIGRIFLRLSFDEIRQYGAGSVRVMRRLRSALVGLADSISDQSRIAAVEQYMHQLDLAISRSPFDAEDRAVASQQDRQGLGVSRPLVQASSS